MRVARGRAPWRGSAARERMKVLKTLLILRVKGLVSDQSLTISHEQINVNDMKAAIGFHRQFWTKPENSIIYSFLIAVYEHFHSRFLPSLECINADVLKPFLLWELQRPILFIGFTGSYKKVSSSGRAQLLSRLAGFDVTSTRAPAISWIFSWQLYIHRIISTKSCHQDLQKGGGGPFLTGFFKSLAEY